MTIKQILEKGLIKDNTEVWIRQGDGFHVLAHGNWYQDDILEHMFKLDWKMLNFAL